MWQGWSLCKALRGHSIKAVKVELVTIEIPRQWDGHQRKQQAEFIWPKRKRSYKLQAELEGRDYSRLLKLRLL